MQLKTLSTCRRFLFQMLSNPRALQAMLQIQEGLRTLQTEVPGVVNMMTPPGQTPAPSEVSFGDLGIGRAGF